MNSEKKSKASGKLLKVGTYAVLMLLLITFVGAPILSYAGRRQNNKVVFGNYNGKDIKYSSNNYFGRLTQTQIENFSKQIQEESMSNIVLKFAMQGAFLQTVEHFALLDMAKKNNIIVTQKAINKKIMDLSFLQRDGKFDIEIYKSLPKRERNQMVALQRDVDIADIMRKGLLQKEYISPEELKFFSMLNQETRQFRYVRFDKSKVQDTSILIKYGEKNPELFKKITFKSLTMADEQELQVVHDSIQNGDTTFSEAVKTYSIDDDKDNEGNRGTLYAYQISDQEGDSALNALVSLQDFDTITDIHKTNDGNFAFYMKVQEDQLPDFTNTELHDTIQSYLNAYDPVILEDAVLKKTRAFIDDANKKGFTTAASQLTLEVGTTKNIPLNINNVEMLNKIEKETDDSPDVKFLASEEEVLTGLFALTTENSISDEYGVGNFFYVFELINIQHAPEFKDITLKEKDITRITNFIYETKRSSLNERVVDKNKLQDNFDNAFNTVYPNNTAN